MDFILFLSAISQQTTVTNVVTAVDKSFFDCIKPWIDTNWFGTMMSIVSGIIGGVLVWLKNRTTTKKREIKQKNKNEIDAFDSIIDANEKFRKAIIDEKDKYKIELELAKDEIHKLDHRLMELERENLRLKDEIGMYKTSIDELKNKMTEFSNLGGFKEGSSSHLK